LAEQTNLTKTQLTELTLDDIKGGFASKTNFKNK